MINIDKHQQEDKTENSALVFLAKGSSKPKVEPKKKKTKTKTKGK